MIDQRERVGNKTSDNCFYAQKVTTLFIGRAFHSHSKKSSIPLELLFLV